MESPPAELERDRPRGERVPCHRRNCASPAAFRVVERYQEETGQGAVEAEALLCVEHTGEEGPSNLDKVYEGYVFYVEPYPRPP